MRYLRLTILPLVLGLGLALLLAVGWLGAPGGDVVDLLIYLLASGTISLAAGIGGAAWLRRGRGPLWFQVTLAFLLGVAVALFNIFLTARLMFISQHDQLLLMLLLLFAAVISIGLGALLADGIARRVADLRRGAGALGAGDLSARVAVSGDDELTELAHEFNRMAALLEQSAVARQRAEGARRDLIAAVSHDLRTPLASLQLLNEALIDGVVDDPATMTRYLTTMRGQIDRLSELIDDLFELARIDAGALQLDLQPVAPGDLISDTIEGLRPQAAARGIMLEGEAAAGLGAVPMAAEKIERVIANLVTNAIRHTPNGGQVTVTARPETGAHTEGVLFEVRDTGEGIAAEDLPHVFERFYRGEKSRSRNTGGAGLGLAIAQGVVRAHGGRIWIESAPGRGTRIAFVIPNRR